MGGIFTGDHSLLLERYDLLDNRQADDFIGRAKGVAISDAPDNEPTVPAAHNNTFRRIGIIAVHRYPSPAFRTEACGFAIVSHHQPKAEGPSQACLEQLRVASDATGDYVGAALLLAMLDAATCLGDDRVADPLRLVERLKQGDLEQPASVAEPVVRSTCQDPGSETLLALDVRRGLASACPDIYHMRMQYSWPNPA